MILKDFLRRWRAADASETRWGRLSKLMLSTTWNFFIAIIVFVVASYLLLPHFLHQENELQRLRQEIEVLNRALNTVQKRSELTDGEGGHDGPASAKEEDGGAVPDPAPPRGP